MVQNVTFVFLTAGLILSEFLEIIFNTWFLQWYFIEITTGLSKNENFQFYPEGMILAIISATYFELISVHWWVKVHSRDKIGLKYHIMDIFLEILGIFSHPVHLYYLLTRGFVDHRGLRKNKHFAATCFLLSNYFIRNTRLRFWVADRRIMKYWWRFM